MILLMVFLKWRVRIIFFRRKIFNKLFCGGICLFWVSFNFIFYKFSFCFFRGGAVVGKFLSLESCL